MQNALVPGWKIVEVQQFICAADSGAFAITFGNETIRNIPYNADVNTFLSYLARFSFYGQLSVSLLTTTGVATNQICTSVGTFVTITFNNLWHRALLADVPAMAFSILDVKGVVTLYLNNANGFIDTESKEVVRGFDSCRIVEEQQILCAATSGKFALTFDGGTTLSGLPFDVTADTLKATIQSNIPNFVDVDVIFANGQTAFCTDLGTTTTIRFVVVKSVSNDGDLAETLTDQTDGGVNGLSHLSNRLQLASSFTEVAKGAACEPLDQIFTPNPTSQMKASVDHGGGTFTVGFRGTTTRPIPARASAKKLKQLLLELPSIQGIDVSYSGSQACETPPNLVSLTFTQNFGDLPTIVADGTQMSAGSSVLVAGSGTALNSIVSVNEECPRGDDFNTDGDVIERQLIRLRRAAEVLLLVFCLGTAIGLVHVIGVSHQLLSRLEAQQLVQPRLMHETHDQSTGMMGSAWAHAYHQDGEGANVLIAYSDGPHLSKLAQAVEVGARHVLGNKTASVRVRTLESVSFTDDVAWADAVILGTHVVNANVEPKMSKFLSEWSIDEDLSRKVGAVFVTSGGISAGEELTMVNLLHSLMIFRMIIVGGERWTSAFGASAISVANELYWGHQEGVDPPSEGTSRQRHDGRHALTEEWR
ncbi:hypothetical protein PHYBOEH_004889 [Phytophthora boehmeriae]|uniref:NADPH-dependent FMN reductase-like domain-containing protein n=1 Tax=Phytophthora boehmeriae TaxID=109152 RepID=A0A8T1X2Z9_9STRA|nr:hypothetical protein PHYBOEH_004889 [Phytophthora boehmeriae]